MAKRQKFILTSLILAVGMLAIQQVNDNYRYLTITILSVSALGLSFWSLKEALSDIRWLTTAILPTMFTAAVALFYFLLPQTLFSQLPVVALYALGIYALLLTENIFSVAAIRTIQLFRAAQAVGFLITLFTGFLLFDTIFSFRFPFWENGLLIMCVSIPLFLQALWSVNLEERISRKIVLYSIFLSIAIMEIAFVLSFWPLTITTASLALTTLFYVLLGLSQAEFQEKLFKQTIYEYLGVGLILLVTLIFTTTWG
jgi:hypothetical protein